MTYNELRSGDNELVDRPCVAMMGEHSILEPLNTPGNGEPTNATASMVETLAKHRGDIFCDPIAWPPKSDVPITTQRFLSNFSSECNETVPHLSFNINRSKSTHQDTPKYKNNNNATKNNNNDEVTYN